MSISEREDCPHDNTEYDPGNYIPPFGWEQRPGTFCVDCGEEIEPEEYGEDMPEDIPDWWDDESATASRYELEEEARNPL